MQIRAGRQVIAVLVASRKQQKAFTRATWMPWQATVPFVVRAPPKKGSRLQGDRQAKKHGLSHTRTHARRCVSQSSDGWATNSNSTGARGSGQRS